MSSAFLFLRENVFEDLQIVRGNCSSCNKSNQILVRPSYCTNKKHMYCSDCDKNVNCKVCKYFIELESTTKSNVSQL